MVVAGIQTQIYFYGMSSAILSFDVVLCVFTTHIASHNKHKEK